MRQLRDDGNGNQDQYGEVAKVRREQTNSRRVHLARQEGRIGNVQVQWSPPGSCQLMDCWMMEKSDKKLVGNMIRRTAHKRRIDRW